MSATPKPPDPGIDDMDDDWIDDLDPDDKIADLTDQIIATGVHTAAMLREMITRTAMTSPEHRAEAQRLLDYADPTTVGHPQLRIVEKHRLSVRRGLSFHAIMLQRSEARRHAGVRDRVWRLDDKAAGYRFADALGVRRPASDLIPRKLEDLTPTPPAVVKPFKSTGARGCYLLMPGGTVIDLRHRETLGSWDEAKARARRLLAAPHSRVRDPWIVEELILDDGAPARDLKFFGFYGEVPCLVEIDRLPEFRRAYLTPDGTVLDTGKPNTLTRPYGASKEQIALAEKISREIPAPFCRIDMLRDGATSAVVGEFTPRSGQFEGFDRATDRWLAEKWVQAERRLLDDALAGKQFEAFDAATAQR